MRGGGAHRRPSAGNSCGRLFLKNPTIFAGLIILIWFMFISRRDFQGRGGIGTPDQRVQVVVNAGKSQEQQLSVSVGLSRSAAEERRKAGPEDEDEDAEEDDVEPGDPDEEEEEGRGPDDRGGELGRTSAEGAATAQQGAELNAEATVKSREPGAGKQVDGAPPSPSHVIKRARRTSDGASSPRYHKEWDSKTFVDVVSNVKKFLASDFAYPEERMIVTHQNFAELVKERMSPRTGRALPKEYPYPRTIDPVTGKVQQPFETCALVGNSGIMQLTRTAGKMIDSHDAVMRVNQGPVKGYERMVGARTTFRLLNKKWVTMYVTKLEGRGVLLPTESRNCTYLATRTGRGSFEKLAATVKRERKDITSYWLSQGVQNRAYKMLAAFRNAASKVHNTKYLGGDAPSSGLIALNFLLQVCNKISVYGLSSERGSSEFAQRNWPYHYFQFRDLPWLHLDSLQLRAHPHHSFEAEGDLIRVLGMGSRIKYCSDPMAPAEKLHNCGWGTPSTGLLNS